MGFKKNIQADFPASQSRWMWIKTTPAYLINQWTYKHLHLVWRGLTAAAPLQLSKDLGGEGRAEKEEE